MSNYRIDPDKCVGCTACMHACPRNSIKIRPNTEGFLSAVIDEETCVNCGICHAVCPIQQGHTEGASSYKKAYACYTKNKEIQNTSTSGGLFYPIAMSVLKKGGKVYGAEMDENLTVKHVCIDNPEDLYKLQGSKYVQSSLGDCFSEIKTRLDSDEYILFSGTGCQVTGLKRFLKKDYENLLTVDLICHGIPSPGMFNDYTTYLEKMYRRKIVSYKFRQKSPKYAQSYNTRITLQKGGRLTEKVISGDDDPYTLNYLQNSLQNEECYRCKFASLKRNSDITLGDYWGISDVHPNFANGNSVSLVLLNSAKALSLWDELVPELECIATDKEKILKHNHQLSVPAPRNPRRAHIYNNYTANNFDKKFYKKFFLGVEMQKYLIKRSILHLLRLE